jgi:hypothetical protein
MQTECRSEKLEFQAPGVRPIVAEFNGGTITSDGGGRCCMHLRATTPSCSEIAWIGLLPFGRSACARENERRAAAALGPGAVDSSQLTIYSALIAGGELLHFKF